MDFGILFFRHLSCRQLCRFGNDAVIHVVLRRVHRHIRQYIGLAAEPSVGSFPYAVRDKKIDDREGDGRAQRERQRRTDRQAPCRCFGWMFSHGRTYPDSTDRVNQRTLGIMIDFVPQPVNVNIDDIRSRIDPHLPYVIQNHRSCYDPARVAAQILQQNEFLRRQTQGLAAAGRFASNEVQLQIADLKAQRFPLLGTGPPQQISHPRQQFGQSERLSEVVVATLLQTQDPFINRPPGGQNQDRNIATL